MAKRSVKRRPAAVVKVEDFQRDDKRQRNLQVLDGGWNPANDDREQRFVKLGHGQKPIARRDQAVQPVLDALQCLEMLDPPEALPRTPVIAFRLTEALVRRSARDQLKRQWKHFDPVKKGEVVAVLDGIGEVTAPHDGVIVLPFVDAEPLTEWLYFAQPEAV